MSSKKDSAKSKLVKTGASAVAGVGFGVVAATGLTAVGAVGSGAGIGAAACPVGAVAGAIIGVAVYGIVKLFNK